MMRILMILTSNIWLIAAVSQSPGEGPRYKDYRCNHDRTHRVCAELKDTDGSKMQWGGTDFWSLTHQSDWSSQVGADSSNPGGGWCICMWATASLISQVGCDNVHIDCAATDIDYVMQSYTDGGTDLAPAKSCLQTKCLTTTLASTAILGGVTADSFTESAQLTFRKAVAQGIGVSADDVSITTFARRSLSVQFEVVGADSSAEELTLFMQSSSSDGFLAVLVEASNVDNTTAFANAVTSIEVTSVQRETLAHNNKSSSSMEVVTIVVVACLVVIFCTTGAFCYYKQHPRSPTCYHQMEGSASKLPLETKEGSGSGASSAVLSNV